MCQIVAWQDLAWLCITAAASELDFPGYSSIIHAHFRGNIDVLTVKILAYPTLYGNVIFNAHLQGSHTSMAVTPDQKPPLFGTVYMYSRV